MHVYEHTGCLLKGETPGKCALKVTHACLFGVSFVACFYFSPPSLPCLYIVYPEYLDLV